MLRVRVVREQDGLHASDAMDSALTPLKLILLNGMEMMANHIISILQHDVSNVTDSSHCHAPCVMGVVMWNAADALELVKQKCEIYSKLHRKSFIYFVLIIDHCDEQCFNKTVEPVEQMGNTRFTAPAEK